MKSEKADTLESFLALVDVLHQDGWIIEVFAMRAIRSCRRLEGIILRVSILPRTKCCCSTYSDSERCGTLDFNQLLRLNG